MDAELTIPATLAITISHDVVHYGARDLETGGFLVAPRGSTRVVGYAKAGTSGIIRGSGLFQISERALDVLFNYVDDHDLWVPCHYHSHKFDAFMSKTDANHGINVEGFNCTIIPGFERPPLVAAEWKWWKFAGETWCQVESPGTSEDEIHVTLTFDEDGVRDG